MLAAGLDSRASAKWLKQWRAALVITKEKGDFVIQPIYEPLGISEMQEAEADMAADKGVAVVSFQFNAADAATIDGIKRAMATNAHLKPFVDTCPELEIHDPAELGRMLCCCADAAWILTRR